MDDVNPLLLLGTKFVGENAVFPERDLNRQVNELPNNKLFRINYWALVPSWKSSYFWSSRWKWFRNLSNNRLRKMSRGRRGTLGTTRPGKPKFYANSTQLKFRSSDKTIECFDINPFQYRNTFPRSLLLSHTALRQTNIFFTKFKFSW